MTDLLELSEREDDLAPEIFPEDSRLSISAQAYTLVSLFSSAYSIVPLKEVIPNTSYVLLEAFDDRNTVEVSATDGERSITLVGPAIVRMSGSTLLPGKKLLDILKLSPQETVRIDVVGTTATVRSGRAVWSVPTPSIGTYFPISPSDEEPDLVSLPRLELLHALEKVSPSISRSTARQSLMQVEVSKAQMTSCDGVRAHRANLPSLRKDFKTTMPLSFVDTAIKELKSSAEESVVLGTDSSRVILGIGKNLLRTQRLSFSFPAVNHLVLGPALQNEETLTVNRADLVNVIKRVKVNSDPEYQALTLSIRKIKGEWNLSVTSRDRAGSASQESLPVDYVGNSTHKDFSVNHKYFLDYLSCMEGTEVELRLGESSKSKQSPIYHESESFTGSLMVMSPNFVKN